MMKQIEFIQGLANAADERVYRRGDVTMWESIEADRFIAAGIAKEVVPASKPKLEAYTPESERGERFIKPKKGFRK